MKHLIAALAAATVAACAAGSGQTERAAYLEQDHINRFEDYKAACIREGGFIVVARKMRSARRATPRRHDSYSCQFDTGVGVGVSF